MKTRLNEILEEIRALSQEVGRSPENERVGDILFMICEELTDIREILQGRA